MSAQGRITSKIMQAYCQKEPDFLMCRVIEGDLQWIGFSIFGVIIALGVGSIIMQEWQKAVKKGVFRRVFSLSAFWIWFRKKGNTFPTIVKGFIPAFMFISSPLLVLLVWIIGIFSIYLYKNWNGEKNV